MHIAIVPGQRFGRLIVVERVPNRHGRQRRFLFRCDCGNLHEADLRHVWRGSSQSCGCLLEQHGMSMSAEYHKP